MAGDARDTQSLVIDAALETADEAASVVDVAARLTPRETVMQAAAGGHSGDDVVAALLHAAVAASGSRLDNQAVLIRGQMQASMQAFRRADPATLKAVSNEDVAARRAEKAAAATKET